MPRVLGDTQAVNIIATARFSGHDVFSGTGQRGRLWSEQACEASVHAVLPGGQRFVLSSERDFVCEAPPLTMGLLK